MNKVVQLQTESIPKLIGALSAPAILSLLANSINMALDRTFISRGVGTSALSALTISLGIYLIIQGFSMLVSVGSAISVTLELGKNEKNCAEKIIGSSIVLSIIMALILSIIGLLCLKPLLYLYGANSENIGFAMNYSTIIVSGAIIFVLSQTTNNLIKGMGYAKKAFFNFFSCVVVNAIIAPIFIFVFKMGVAGAAYATLIGNVVCVILAIQFLTSKKTMANLKISNMKLERLIVRKIIPFGTPACVVQLALSLVALTFNHVAFHWGGNIAVAAYGIIYTLSLLIYMPIMGLAQGIQPIIGYNYSSKIYARVKETLKHSILFSTYFCVLMFVVIELFSNQIITLIVGNGDAQLIEITTVGLRFFCAMLPLVGFQMIGSSYFQFVGKMKQSVILTALRQLILLIPLALILPQIFGINGLWVATPISDFLSFIVTLVFVVGEFRFLTKTEKDFCFDATIKS